MSSSRLSNDSLGMLNLLTFLFSIPIVLAGILLGNDPAITDCERFLYKPLVLVGVFLMLVSLTGFIGACCHLPGLLWIYLVFMFFLILAGVVFTLFAFVVTNKGAGSLLSGKGYKEYRLGDYSNWLQKRVNNNGNWNKIKSCLAESKICTDLNYRFHNDSHDEFQKEPLNGLQSGCCKPSNDCDFVYGSPTFWIEENGVYKNPDCKAWDNDHNVLCFDCQSCKAGVLDNIQNSWKKVGRINIICLILLILVYSVGCCAFRNIMRDDQTDYRRGLQP